jgi:nucleotide-binding universal stress UspA family protein
MKPTILLAYDFSPAADAALRWVVELQALTHGKTHLVHVVDTIALSTVSEGGLGMVEPGVGPTLASLRDVARQGGLEAEPQVLLGSGIGSTLLDTAREVGADLIAIGTHGRGLVGRLVMGSVAQFLVQEATIPVIVFHAPAAPPAPAV